MRLLSWNVNGRAGAQQRTSVLRREADVVALQEVTRQSYEAWIGSLVDGGYSVVSTIDLAALRHPGTLDWKEPLPDGVKRLGPRPRRYFNLLAARGSLAGLPGLTFDEDEYAPIAFPEKFVSARAVFDGIQIDVHNAHVPDAATVGGAIKLRAYEAIRRRVDEDTSRPQILCGDFNCQIPDEEYRAGTRERPKRRHEWKRRWDAAERSVIENADMPDVYTTLREGTRRNGRLAVSHYIGPNRKPMRLDHVLASREITATRCKYWEEWLRAGLSDHAAVEVELEFELGASGPLGRPG
jgi:endonuclease/exonuclease/phosphatase family metal-dependent hydrolase